MFCFCSVTDQGTFAIQLNVDGAGPQKDPACEHGWSDAIWRNAPAAMGADDHLSARGHPYCITELKVKSTKYPEIG